MREWKKKCVNLYVRLVRCFCGIKKHRVVFESFNGKSYSDNVRAISEALHSIAPKAQIVWLFRDPKKKQPVVPTYVKCIKMNALRYYREIATAKAYVSNCSFSRIPKSSKQFFIQTWHGDKAFKKVLHDSLYYPNRVLAEQIDGYCDLAVAGSEYGEKQYRSAFLYPGRILMVGTPRNDQLLTASEQKKEKIRQKLCCEDNTKVFLYAPTLRRAPETNRQLQRIQDIDLSRVITLLEKRDNCHWRCLLRAHPSIIGLDGAGDDVRIIDVTTYEDMADLLLIADMLITDYSSCAGDFALTRRPVVLFQSDKQEYQKNDRRFYFDIEESPYWVANDQKELETILENITPEKAKENCEEILRFYGDKESGCAAERVATMIKEWIEQ